MRAEATQIEAEGPAGFRGFYRAHYGFVCRAVERFGVSVAEQGDAVQDTFVIAYRKRDGMRGSSTRAWLYGIARRVASNYRRGARRVARKHEAARDAVASISPQTLDALHTLDRFLAQLDERDREVFVLSELLGLSGPEIAEAIAMRPGLVYARLRLLRGRVAESAPDDLFAALCRVRSDEPRASTKSWLAFVAMIGKPPAWLGGLGLARLAVAIAPLSIGAAIMGASEAPRAAAIAPATIVAPEIGAAPLPAVASPPRAPAPSVIATREPTPTPVRRVERPRAPELHEDGNALLAAAIAALERGEPARALTLTDEHAQRFANSPLADTRWALRIEALCHASKSAQARGEARAFLAAHPGSPSADAVRRGCRADENATDPDTLRSR
ncbi:MAG TPA: sigma-70 family RNA polymerase sigma factor [Nannocystaceae bacterium]|nr:sigma-70 family RNA polymerase sigma factor [Nannocystaceae bacterium]